jgi:hypothetical protein
MRRPVFFFLENLNLRHMTGIFLQHFNQSSLSLCKKKTTSEKQIPKQNCNSEALKHRYHSDLEHRIATKFSFVLTQKSLPTQCTLLLKMIQQFTCMFLKKLGMPCFFAVKKFETLNSGCKFELRKL